MADETQAVSSPAEVADPFKGEQPSLAEFTEYREKGTLPERFKTAVTESAPADAQEETEESEAEKPEHAAESDSAENQEQKPQSKRDKRIQQLLNETAELKRQLAAKTDVKPEPSTVKADPQYTRPKPKPDGNGPDGKPYEAYEDYVEDLADWKAEQRIEGGKRDEATKAANAALKVKLDEARTRYKDADDVIFPANKAIQEAKIPMAVKEVFGQSDVFVDLCYVVGSDPDELESFLALAQSNPRAAIAKVFEYERGIAEALAKPRDENGQFTAPEKKKTSAPKPPAPVGGASSKAFDASDDSLSADEWMRKRNEEVSRRT